MRYILTILLILLAAPALSATPCKDRDLLQTQWYELYEEVPLLEMTSRQGGQAVIFGNRTTESWTFFTVRRRDGHLCMAAAGQGLKLLFGAT